MTPHSISRTLAPLPLLATALLLAACATSPSTPNATAKLTPTTGNTVSGNVYFTRVGDKVKVSGEISGLKPGSTHGFHIHEVGDCSSGDGMSAGGHFNPTGVAHGQADHGAHHAGDLPSLDADAKGVVTLEFMSDSIALDGKTNVIGRGLIVHRDPDDFKTQPTGNSGPRLACAVITKN